MNRENLLFAIIGILFGFIVGFMSASIMNQKYGPSSPTASASQAMPADHPPVGAQNAGNPQGMQAEVQESIAKAKNEPKNFDAQLKAAELYYQIQRYDQAIEFLLKANDKNHPLEMQQRFIASYRKRGGVLEEHTFEGLPEHRMVPSPDNPETMRFIDIVTAFIRRQTR